MYNRLKSGEFIAMTAEEKKQHKHLLNKRYREAHPDKIHEQNLYYYNLYKTTKPHVCICKKCGKKFNAPRHYFKWCDDCKNKNWTEARKQMILDRRNERKRKHELVFELNKQGLEQNEIAKRVGYCQRNVSAILVRAGIRKIKKHARSNVK